ncbi:MAG TPA: nuclear transport factor 2 family protein [Solirubrobacteraceae bacterium]|nr:nuclear transport factor 2 family protein [Solirubrobacteraceae bacterium]
MSQQNVEIVRLQNEAFNRGDVATVLELADPGIEWWDREDDPGATVHRGHDGLTKALAELADLTELHVEAKEFIDAGEYVVVPVRLTGRGRASDAVFAEDEVHVFRLHAAKITELREYRNITEALEAVGLAGEDEAG